MNRLDWDEYFLGMAEGVSARSTCSRLSVGAILVNKYNNVVGHGYNGAPRGVAHCMHFGSNDPCKLAVHAEANALVFSRETAGTVMYVTHAPCFECAKLIINAQVQHVVYRNMYRSEEGLDMLYMGGVSFTQL